MYVCMCVCIPISAPSAPEYTPCSTPAPAWEAAGSLGI